MQVGLSFSILLPPYAPLYLLYPPSNLNLTLLLFRISPSLSFSLFSNIRVVNT